MTRVRSCPSGWAVVRSSHDPVVRAVIEHGIPGVWSIAHSTSIRFELSRRSALGVDRSARSSTGRLIVCADNGIELLNRLPFMSFAVA